MLNIKNINRPLLAVVFLAALAVTTYAASLHRVYAASCQNPTITVTAPTSLKSISV